MTILTLNIIVTKRTCIAGHRNNWLQHNIHINDWLSGQIYTSSILPPGTYKSFLVTIDNSNNGSAKSQRIANQENRALNVYPMIYSLRAPKRKCHSITIEYHLRPSIKFSISLLPNLLPWALATLHRAAK